ncbi:MAG: TetR/AcrR family transcriptional regulator [Gammaproteobacteria bacterium]|nr:TetR/AcrR family transcriptional regulator [Gammaproteobacteria bacterium]
MTATADPVRTQRRGVETKRRLVEATKGLLAEFDYQTITLDQISSSVGVAKSSILWHFGSKDALLTEAVFDLFDEIDEKITLEKANLETMRQRIVYLLESVADYFTSNPEAKGIAITLLFNSKAPEEIRLRIRAHWDRHIEQIADFLSSDADPVSRDSAAALMALMHGCYLQWHLQGRKDDLRSRLLDTFEALSPDYRIQ